MFRKKINNHLREAKMSEDKNENNNNNDVQLDVKQENKQPENVYTKEQVDELVAGLKNKNDELLGKLKKQKEKVEEDTLKSSQDYEGLKSLYEQQKQELEDQYKDKLTQAQRAIIERDKLDVLNQLSSEFVDSTIGTQLVKNLVEIEDGKQVFRDFSGNIVADNVSDFKKWMATNDHMSHIVKGVQSTGGGANGGAGKAGAANELTRSEFNKMTDGERWAWRKTHGKFNIIED